MKNDRRIFVRVELTACVNTVYWTDPSDNTATQNSPSTYRLLSRKTRTHSWLLTNEWGKEKQQIN